MAFIFVLSTCWLLFWGVKVQRKNDIQTRKTEKNNILRIVIVETIMNMTLQDPHAHEYRFRWFQGISGFLCSPTFYKKDIWLSSSVSNKDR
jgi:hypothetical protein